MSTDEMVAWIREQLDDDERACTIIVRGPRQPGKALAAHILREVEAARRILDVHDHQVFAFPDHHSGETRGCVVCHSTYEDFAGGWCDTVKLMALPYCDRPGYREEWRP